MSKFKRGIENQSFINALNANDYWKEIIKDKDLFIAIRDKYISVYYYGQVLTKIEYIKNEIKWTSHKKYLGLDKNGYTHTGKYLDRLDELKQNAKKYCGKEKEQVKKHVLDDKSLCVIDVEVTFGKEPGFSKRSIDYLVVEKNDSNELNLVFYEAKTFDNNEIRARETPKVFEQMEKYEMALKNADHRKEILESYKTIYNNLIDLNLDKRNNLSKMIGENIESLKVNDEPRLIIFGIDKGSKDDIHLEKLKNKFGEKRLILKYK